MLRKALRHAVPATVAVGALVAAALAAGPAQAAAPAGPANSTGTAAPAPALAGKAAPGTPALPDGYGPTPAQQQAMDAASKQATATGKPVVVAALTTPTWQVLAQPGGGFSLADNPAPVRAQAHGAWVPVDTTLHRNASGTYTAAATAYASVTFSGGGHTPLAVTTTPSGASYRINWPTTLPAPAVSGSTATYDNVLPGVDLQVSADITGGFSEVLIVHNATAAANPALARITLAAQGTGGADARTGTLATSHDGLSLQASSALMWDSNTAPTSSAQPGAAAQPHTANAPGAASPAQIAASDPSTAGAPGLAAHTARIGIGLGAHTLTLTPDRGLLTAKNAVWPMFIDPTFSWHSASGGTPAYDEVKQDAPCNSVSNYDNKSSSADYGELGVGYLPSAYSPTCEGDERAYYQWKLPSVIDGGTINTSSVNVTEVWQASFACTLNRTINLHLTGAIGSGTDWNNKPGWTTGSNAFDGSTTIGAAYSSGCTTDGDAYAAFNVKTPIQTAAKDNSSQITFVLTDDAAESAKTGTDFSRFEYNPTLDIEFGHTPPIPATSNLSASSGASDTAACDTTSPYPYIGKAIASNPITLKAADITSKDGDELQATFKYWLTSTPSTTYTGTSANNLASGASATFALPSTFTSALTDGANVAWEVETSNGEWSSGYSAVCTFTAEPTAPDAPTIAANTTYPEDTTGAAAGTSATFAITGNSDGATATKFYYLLDKAPATSSTPASETVTATSGAASITETPAAPGPHTLYVDAVDAAGDVSSTASYGFIAAGHAGTTCATLASCFNNVSISADATPTQASADTTGNSFSATDLNNAGWTSGGEITIDGAPLTLPAFGSGQADNVIAANQTVTCTTAGTLNCAVPSAGASSLVLLTTGTNSDFADPGSIAGDATAPFVPNNDSISGAYCFTGGQPDGYCAPEGVITYTDGSQQSYFLTVPDWVNGPASLAAAVFPHRNTTSGQKVMTTKMYPFAIPLSPGLTIASITLPDDSSLNGATNAIHVYSMATRDTTTGTVKAGGTVAAAASGDSWTGAWASDTEGSYNFQSANFSNQSFRVLVQPSVTGTTVRVKLDNSLGTNPIDIGHATVATTSGNDITPTAATTSTPVALKFNGATTTVVPEGGMVFSDPLAFNVTAGQWLAVSFQITNSVASLVQHSYATDAYEYAAPPNSGDLTTATAATGYTASGNVNGTFTDLVTGLDVQTAGVATQVVLGDNLIDAWQANTAPLSPNNGNAVRLSDDLASASATTPVPFGTVNAGIESNQVTVDYPQAISDGAVGGPSVLSRIDRDVLDEPGISTVIVDEGLEDALTGASEVNLENGFDDLLGELSATETAPGGATFVNAVDIGLTPCATYAGDGETGTGTAANDPCTAAVDTTRTDVNTFLTNGTDLGLNPWTSATFYYVDPDAAIGVPDTSLSETQLAPKAEVGTSRGNSLSDPVNLTNAGTGSLADAVLAAQDTWILDDGDANTSAADDAMNNYSNAYLTSTDPNAGNSDLTLNGTYTWPTATVGSAASDSVLNLDGATGYGTTTAPVLNTAASFSISAWADLTSLPTTAAAIAAQSGTEASGFTLQYNPASTGWCLDFATTDTAGAGNATGSTCSTTAPAANTWYHLVGTYNATTHTSQLYVNGTLAHTGTGLTTWNATGPLTVGEAQASAAPAAFFPGNISNLQAWNYVLSAPQVSALYDQIQ